MLAYLETQVSGCMGFDAQAVGNACYGLQSLTNCWEVRQLVNVLASKVAGCAGPFDAQEVGNACYGLQSLTDGGIASIVGVGDCALPEAGAEGWNTSS